jgi:prevent-host-death family protein
LQARAPTPRCFTENGYCGHNSHRGAKTAMKKTLWTVAEAKAKLSEVIDRAQSEGPQTITRNGRTAVVLVSFEEWERKTKRTGNLAEFFAGSPLRESGLSIERSSEKPREIEP